MTRAATCILTILGTISATARSALAQGEQADGIFHGPRTGALLVGFSLIMLGLLLLAMALLRRAD